MKPEDLFKNYGNSQQCFIDCNDILQFKQAIFLIIKSSNKIPSYFEESLFFYKDNFIHYKCKSIDLYVNMWNKIYK